MLNHMAKLNEYIGALVSSVANARMLSDIQTVEVAKAYAKHPLLKHFSVARMKIEDVELTIPVAIEEGDTIFNDVLEPIDRDKLSKSVLETTLSALKISKVPRAFNTELQREINKQMVALEENIKTLNDKSPVQRFASHMADYACMLAEKQQAITGFEHTSAIEAVKNAIERAALEHVVFTSKPRPLGDLNVIFESHRLKDLRPESLVTFKMRVSEEGLEWLRSENDGVVEERLLPE